MAAELDYISILMQLFVEHRRDGSFSTPTYTSLGQTGTANMPTHTILLTAMWRGEKIRVQKSARSIQEAKREAARTALEKILDQGAVIFDAPQAPESAAHTYPTSNGNAKNDLQEMVQSQPGNPVPNYETVSISGSQHQPNFCMKVIVKWNGKMLEELGKGRTKTAAGNCAAERMLQRLNGRSPSPIEFPADHTTGADNVSDGDDKGGDDEQEGALDRAKNRLQEALQAKGCMLPYYTLKHQYGPDHSPTFTVTLTVLNRAGRTIHMEEASASPKPRAEKLCAHRALPTVKTLLDNMCDEELNQPCTPPSTSAAEHSSASSSEMAFDETQLAILRTFTSHMPHPMLDRESSDNSVLCLVSVQMQDGTYMLAQGQGSTESSAMYYTMESLLQNLQQQLYYSV